MGLDSIVNSSISLANSAVQLPSLNRALIPVLTSVFSERFRSYRDPADMLADGFLSSDQVFKEVTAHFSQNPRPETVIVGKRSAAVAQVERLHVAATTDGSYSVTIDGQTATFAASSNTATQIKDGLVSAINALVPKLGQTNATAASASSTDLTITGDDAGIPLAVTISGPAAGAIVFTQNALLASNSAGTYTLIIGSTAYPLIANGTTSASDLCDALILLVNADTSEHGVTAVAGTGDSIDFRAATTFTLTATSTGSTITVSQRTLVHGLVEDLAAITDAGADWYCLLLTERDAKSILTCAAAIEAQKRIFLAQTADAAVIALPYNADTPEYDIATKIKVRGYARTAVWYHSDSAAGLAAGVAGEQIPKTPGSSTYKFKSVAGVATIVFTTTQETNLISKNANGYYEVAGRSITFEGITGAGEYIDTTTGSDDLNYKIQANLFGSFVASEKIDMTTGGIAIMVSGVDAAIQQKVSDHFIASDRVDPVSGKLTKPAYTITPPKISEISASDRAHRRITASNPIRWEATLAGAIHNITVRGTITA